MTKAKSKIKIYLCGSAMSEIGHTDVKLYESAESCSDAEPCTDSCGIVELELDRASARTVTGSDPTVGPMSAKAYTAAEAKFIKLAKKLDKALSGSDAETAFSAVQWCFAGLRNKRSAKRRKARELRKPRKSTRRQGDG